MSIAFITGSTRGLGFATAQALAEAGHSVIISGRTEKATDEARAFLTSVTGVNVDAVTLDVTDEMSILSAAETIRTRYGVLDILVNNAGVVLERPDIPPTEYSSVDVFRATFETNVFGVIAVTNALTPLLRTSTAGRIVNVSSTMGSLSDQADPDSAYFSSLVHAYRTSKAALNSVTIGLSKQLADSTIVVTAVCPGFVQTELTPLNQDAPLTAGEAAGVILNAALLPAGSPSGTFVDAHGPVSW
ncbi:SDR family oxidoreductase [Klugiella xanthotipulae]|uniref:Short-subunit dehydrogenase n=1 Tax=Klugiella xanthotipulae TaxID=244735 RepID=A0A543HGZ1_9MICO|nr:SDR family NAD(P)-dependent oxidoreductase [Klugiella xanthotipulae]TQM57583.1 short-subunit dehydrogenase [Klugiella xanthotipulae]